MQMSVVFIDYISLFYYAAFIVCTAYNISLLIIITYICFILVPVSKKKLFL